MKSSLFYRRSRLSLLFFWSCLPFFCSQVLLANLRLRASSCGHKSRLVRVDRRLKTGQISLVRHALPEMCEVILHLDDYGVNQMG